ncbi:MSMEG_0570 family nitrogen starvation response protein [Rhodovulum sp. DZ06]|uniref:MSMEG_0570 family nitrogen starvation response protein n=1 Tax=Rhodovulum sp. DZ06 TaxID=3425126 RepID=UPI003D336BF3
MPETIVTFRWPDGTEEPCYSPSSVIAEMFAPGAAYPLSDFLARARIGLERASGRVERKYGFRCSRAMASLDRIEARAAACPEDARILCVSIQ